MEVMEVSKSASLTEGISRYKELRVSYFILMKGIDFSLMGYNFTFLHQCTSSRV
jgi:hypothetical protein